MLFYSLKLLPVKIYPHQYFAFMAGTNETVNLDIDVVFERKDNTNLQSVFGVSNDLFRHTQKPLQDIELTNQYEKTP